MIKRTQRELEMGEKTLESLARRIGELDELIEAENSTEEFVRSMRNPNTVRKTTADVNKIEQWLLSKTMRYPSSGVKYLLGSFFYDCN